MRISGLLHIVLLTSLHDLAFGVRREFQDGHMWQKEPSSKSILDASVYRKRIGKGPDSPVRIVGTPLVVKQYNILAEYMGDNWMPWFLYGANLTHARTEAGSSATGDAAYQDEITAAYFTRSPQGKFVNNKGNFYNHTQQDKLKLRDQAKAISARQASSFNWEERKINLVKEIVRGEPDVVFLEELDHYVDFFRDALAKFGYNGQWVKRPRSVSHDGCAIFWKASRLELVSNNSVFSKNLRNTNGKTDRIALAVGLRDRENGRKIMAVATHLARNPTEARKDSTRMAQLHDIDEFVEGVVAEMGLQLTHPDGKTPPKDAVIFAGDFNSMRQDLRDSDRNTGSKDIMSEDIDLGAGWLINAFPGYARGDDDCTTKTRKRRMWIDYIFYSPAFAIQNAFKDPCPDDDQIPSPIHPSDHLPIAARLGWRQFVADVEEYSVPVRPMSQM